MKCEPRHGLNSFLGWELPKTLMRPGPTTPGRTEDFMESEVTAKCSCSHCGTHLEFAQQSAGEWVTCPNCQSDTELKLDLPPATDAERPSAAQLVASFGGPIKPVRVTFFYQLGLLLVTLMMLLLPVLYLALIALAGWGVYWYATHCWGLFSFLRTNLYLLCELFPGPSNGVPRG
jgi:hypothetical protein